MSQGKRIDSLDPVIWTDKIAERAYLLYLARGSQDGQDLEDWLQAEGQLREETKSSPPA
jgi:DUF2934 family protein